MRKICLIRTDEIEKKLYSEVENGRIPDCFLSAADKNRLRLKSSDSFKTTPGLVGLVNKYACELAQMLPKGLSFLSIGPGSRGRDRILLKELVSRSPDGYYASDVNAFTVDQALEEVSDIPVKKSGIIALFEDIDIWKVLVGFPVLLGMLGNSFSNYEPESIMNKLDANLGPEDFFLFDCTLFPDNPASEADSMLQRDFPVKADTLCDTDLLCTRGLKPEDAEFSVEMVPVESRFGRVYRTRKKICIKKEGSISCAGRRLELRKGETFELGFTYMYRMSELRRALEQFGFSIRKLYRDGADALVLASRET